LIFPGLLQTRIHPPGGALIGYPYFIPVHLWEAGLTGQRTVRGIRSRQDVRDVLRTNYTLGDLEECRNVSNG
jgi:hypothetical protein